MEALKCSLIYFNISPLRINSHQSEVRVWVVGWRVYRLLLFLEIMTRKGPVSVEKEQSYCGQATCMFSHISFSVLKTGGEDSARSDRAAELSADW